MSGKWVSARRRGIVRWDNISSQSARKETAGNGYFIQGFFFTIDADGFGQESLFWDESLRPPHSQVIPQLAK